MAHLWFFASLGAAFFQSLRYATLKELNKHLSASVTTYVRMLFGLPFLAAYLWAVLGWTGEALPASNVRFWAYAGLTAILQYVMTLLAVQLFRIGNFAVGVMLTRVDVILTAILGSLFFSERITTGGWAAILLTVAGVLTASAGRMSAQAWGQSEVRLIDVLFGPATRLGLSSATLAAISYLALRESILSLDATAHPMVRSAYASVAMTVQSFVLIGLWLFFTERRELGRLGERIWLTLVTGFISAAGTIAWFTASALTNAAYVAAVAQVQIVFALIISRYWFRETIRPLEIAGIGLIVAGVLMFRLV
ncbi:MAG: DMT family transporter [Proteobacteria bacterium]|nr:DMT family transporter [Pseudomonadota bacterium]